MNWVIILLYILSGLLIWQFVGYPLVMAMVAILSKPKDKDYEYQPFVSIIVPAYNEEKVIEKRIENLLSLDYPKDKYEVIVVESGSSDNTYEIARNIVDRNNGAKFNLKLLQEQQRKGKASAINFGSKHARGDIILVTDANSVFNEKVLREIAPHFKNPKIGGVGGRYLVSNPESGLASAETFYWDLEYIMRMGEAALGSACLFHGEINAWRKGLIDADTKMLSEDADMGIRITRQGYKIGYEPKAWVYELSATTSRDQIIQRKRTSIGVIQCIFKHWDYFLFPRNLYSSFIFPSHKSLQLVSPFMLLAILGLYAIAWDVKVIATHFILTMFVFALLFGVLMLLKSSLTKDEKMGQGFSISAIPRITHYVLLNEYLILLAWKDFIFKRYSVLWQKVGSARNMIL